MRPVLLIATLIVTLGISSAVFAGTPQSTCRRSPIGDSRQLLLSILPGWDDVASTVTLFEKDVAGRWKATDLTRMKAVVGRNGLAWGTGLHDPAPNPSHVKQEGDGRAPAGVFALTESFGYEAADLVGFGSSKPLNYHRVDRYSVCVDDPLSKSYNRIIYDERTVQRDWNSHEDLRRADELYRYAIVVAHNPQNIPRGDPASSCTFGLDQTPRRLVARRSTETIWQKSWRVLIPRNLLSWSS